MNRQLTCLLAMGVLVPHVQALPCGFEDVHRVDAIVVGGTAAAVSAALAAKEGGANVLLLAPRPYLGEDVAGTLDLDAGDRGPADHAVVRAIWEGEEETAPFSYVLTTPASTTLHPHKDGMLCDGLSDDAVTQAVQFDSEKVRIDLDLPDVTDVTSLDVVAFEKTGKSMIREMHAVYNDEQDKVSPVFTIPKKMSYSGVARTVYRVAINKRIRRLAIGLTRAEGMTAVMLGEIVLRKRKTDRTRRQPTPIEVKSALDALLLSHGIRYRTGTLVTHVLEDASGRVCGVDYVSRQGRHRAVSRTVIDATKYGSVILAGGGTMRPYPAGTTVTREMVALSAPQGEGLKVETLPRTAPVFIQNDGNKYGQNQTARFYRCSFVTEREVPIDPQGVGELEMLARDKTTCKGEVDAADEVILPVPQVETGVDGVTFVGASGDLAGVERIVRTLLAQSTTPVLGGLRRRAVAARSVSCDVVIVGGGTAGAPAAIGAARCGAKTLTLDYQHRLGGVGTSGIGYYWYGKKCGFTQEAETGLMGLGYAVKSAAKAEWWRRENRTAGGEIWFGCLGTGALLSGRTVTGVVTATPFGPYRITAKVTIDATGSADIVAAAKGKTEFIDSRELTVQGAGLPTKRLGWIYTNSDWGLVNDNDLTGSWLFALQGRLGAKGEWDVSQLLATRERRRMVGRLVVQPLDILNARKFRDTIAQGQTDFDTHGPTIADCCLVGEFDNRNLFDLNIPFRALLPENLDNIAAVGIGASAHRDAMPFMRMQADVQNEGYAAGYAAALAVRAGQTLAEIDIRALQRHLVEKGSIPAEAATWEDTPAYSAAVLAAAAQTVGQDYKGVGIALSDPQTALPHLRNAYAAATTERERLCLAHVLGILGDPTGAETLYRNLMASTSDRLLINPDDKKSFGRRLGEYDSQLVALGRSGSPLAEKVIVTALRGLSTGNGYTRARAIDLAIERHPRASLAPILAETLAKDRMGGHAHAAEALITPRGGFGMDNESGACLKELHLARALWLCGDYHSLAKKTLEAYAADPRGVFAAHAKAILQNR